MNSLDWILAAAIAAAAVYGYVRGFVNQLFSLAGMIAAYIVAFTCYKSVAPWLGKLLPLHTFTAYQKYEFVVNVLHLDTFIMNAIAFSLLFFGVKIGIIVIGRLFNLVAKAPGLNALNRWSGLLLGAAECILLAVVAVNVMTVLPSDRIQALVGDSTIAQYILGTLPSMAGKLQQIWNEGASTLV